MSAVGVAQVDTQFALQPFHRRCLQHDIHLAAVAQGELANAMFPIHVHRLHQRRRPVADDEIVVAMHQGEPGGGIEAKVDVAVLVALEQAGIAGDHGGHRRRIVDETEPCAVACFHLQRTDQVFGGAGRTLERMTVPIGAGVKR